MAIIITPEVSGLPIDTQKRYKYLFEPLRVQIEESSSGGATVTIDVIMKSLINGTTISTKQNYIFSELNIQRRVVLDLMEPIKDLIPQKIFQIGSVNDIGTNTIIPVFYVEYSITTNMTSTPTILRTTPIFGGRKFAQYKANVLHTDPINEWQYYGIAQPQFNGYPLVSVSLKSSTMTDISPTITISTPTTGRCIDGGYLVWKSRFGGWMSYGFDIMTEDSDMRYSGDIDRGLFDVAQVGGSPYIEPDYTSIEESYSVSLKSIGVNKNEAKALKGLSSSPAIYLMRDKTSPLELMKLRSVSIPLNNMAEGTDVTINLSSISQSSQIVK